MNINLAKLEQAEMDKVSVNSPNIYATGFAKDSSRTDWHPFPFHVYPTSLKLNKTYITLRFLT